MGYCNLPKYMNTCATLLHAIVCVMHAHLPKLFNAGGRAQYSIWRFILTQVLTIKVTHSNTYDKYSDPYVHTGLELVTLHVDTTKESLKFNV